jgi:hypothetical protein
MARFNTTIPVATGSGAQSLGTTNAGSIYTITGTAPFTVTIGDPLYLLGQSQVLFNTTSGDVTVQSSGSGIFIGSGASGSSTQIMPAGSLLSVTSNGTNWVVQFDGGGNLVCGTFSAAKAVTLSPASANVTISPSGSGNIIINPAGTLANNTIDNVTIGATTRGSALFTTLGANGAVTLSPAALVTISPTGGLTIAPSSVTGTMDNVTIGATTRGSALFTTLGANGQVSFTAGTASSTTGTGTIVVTGGVGVSGQVTCATLVETSSIAFKENVQPLTNALDVVMQLMGVTYDRKDNKKHEAGLIAEEVFKFAPELVSLDANGKPYGIQYTKLGAYLVESIKTLKEEINLLKGIK